MYGLNNDTTLKKSIVIFLCFFSVAVSAQNYTISGFIKDAENGENLIGATILDKVSGKGTISNAFGFFSLTLLADTVDLTIAFVGFTAGNQKFFLNENKSLNIDLNPGGLLEEVVITGEESIEMVPQMSTVQLGVEQIKAIPALLGESDVLKTIQLLPGVQSGTEGTSGIYVRGGGPDQNLILLDGVPVYNASHLFGFFSVFNPEAINNVSLIKGGFPARYGGRLSSVIDISMKEGNNQEFKGHASIGLISSKLTLEGPIRNENTSFIISGRRTYIDLLARPIIKAETQGDGVFGYYFHDMNAKINHRFSDKDRVYLSFYGGKDDAYAREEYEYFEANTEYEEENEFGLDWGNLISAFRWNHLFTPQLFMNLTATYSRYQFGIFGGVESISRGIDGRETIRESIEYTSGIQDYAVKLDFDYLPTPDHNIKLGVNSIRHEFNPGVFAFVSNQVSDTTIGVTSATSWEFSSYVEDDFAIGKNLRFNLGLHGSYFLVENKDYYALQPRLSGRLFIPGWFTIKASYAEMAQFIHLLTNGGIGLPTDLWVPSTNNIKPQFSEQIAFGMAKDLGNYQISVESYYKWMRNLIEYEDGASYLNATDSWEDKVVSGDGTSYGIEFLLEKKVGRLNGWIGYTWSKTFREFEDLNFGEPYPYKFDRRHDASVVAIYQLSDGISISGTWVYGTGNAISLPSTQYAYLPERPSLNAPYGYNLEYYDERNNFRMRSYHRLDLSLAFSKLKKRGTRTWSMGAYNVYNRRNPFFIDINVDRRGNRKFVQYSLFPILPFIKYSFEF